MAEFQMEAVQFCPGKEAVTVVIRQTSGGVFSGQLVNVNTTQTDLGAQLSLGSTGPWGDAECIAVATDFLTAAGESSPVVSAAS
jgi:hypothetical protein